MTTPAVVVAGIRSGVGKTTVTIGLISAMVSRGKKVAAFKIGPDFIDPSHYASAGAVVVRNLDPVLQGDTGMRGMFSKADGCSAAVVEGVMGIFDGPIPGKITGSTADVAIRLGLPVLLVCDARSCAQSVAAEIVGVMTIQPGLVISGVILNFVGSKRHADLLVRGVKAIAGVRVVGCLYRDGLPSMPGRHLGLVPATEFDAAKKGVIDKYRDAVESALPVSGIFKTTPRKPHGIGRPKKSMRRAVARSRMHGAVTIAIARDEAFSFYYPESIEFFSHRGAAITYFSPLRDPAPPEADLYYLGGGFPEVFAARLSANTGMRDNLRYRFQNGAKAYAECGGLMYLADEIATTAGKSFNMTGALPGRCIMHTRRQALGYWKARATATRLFLKKNMTFVGHEYHWSTFEPSRRLRTVYTAEKIGADDHSAGGWMNNNVFASYLHLSAAGNQLFFSRLMRWAAGGRTVATATGMINGSI